MSLRKVNKGGVLIECGTEEEINKLKEEVATNPNLKDQVEFRSLVKVKPKIIIYGVEDDLNTEVGLNTLREQNEELKESELKHKYLMKTNRGTHWIISLDPDLFHKVIKIGKIYVGWFRLRVREYLFPKQCFNYYRYGYIGKNCQNKE
ncbi:hypothetical protein AVEN_126892-1 [Araneus ventricosus]|uniref:Uncharacterized protein n=1 Tax=Araneus ventricosus TaxID=182803 RepID=A0A4Y2C1M0_ARAVE|nr:hypothetical protein AVEN_126892-1 [Araneus ventricosus]